MNPTLRWMFIGVTLFLLDRACAQPVPIHPGPIIVPRVPVSTGADRPAWADTAQHYRLTLDYDGKRFKLVKASVGEGSARSYLSEQRDIVVLILGPERKILRQFNLRDPLEVRIWDSAIDVHARTAELDERMPSRRSSLAPASTPLPHEHIARRNFVRFDLFIPKQPEAQQVELRKHSARGALLGSIALDKSG